VSDKSREFEQGHVLVITGEPGSDERLEEVEHLIECPQQIRYFTDTGTVQDWSCAVGYQLSYWGFDFTDPDVSTLPPGRYPLSMWLEHTPSTWIGPEEFDYQFVIGDRIDA
jgi:hypothetical protein